MQGFDQKFRDLPDYILKITYQIWEDKDVESIREYYAKGIPVRSPAGVVYGPDAVVKATYATLEEFPDRQLLGEDVIWICLLYTSPSPRDVEESRMPSSA